MDDLWVALRFFGGLFELTNAIPLSRERGAHHTLVTLVFMEKWSQASSTDIQFHAIIITTSEVHSITRDEFYPIFLFLPAKIQTLQDKRFGNAEELGARC